MTELFREFLKFTGYSHTLSVFDAEAGTQPDEPQLSRITLTEELGLSLDEDAANLPLIYAILEALKRINHDRREAPTPDYRD